MVPGCVAGLYTAEETQIQLGPLAKWASIDLLPTRVVELDPEAQEVKCADGSTLSYDALSLDIGSVTRGAASVPGVAEHAPARRSHHCRRKNELLRAISALWRDLPWVADTAVRESTHAPKSPIRNSTRALVPVRLTSLR